MSVKLQKIIEELILVILISMNIFEVFGLLPGEAGFVKAIISMTGLGYVIYKASLSDLFFGQKSSFIDFVLITSYFLLIVNKIVQFSNVLVHESHYWKSFFEAIVINGVFIETISFYIGAILILLVSLIVALFINIQGPSIMNTLHGNRKFKLGFVGKFFSVLMIIQGFYLIFFNLVMEWLTLVIDAPLIMVAIFLYIFKLHDLSKSMDSEVILFKIADFVEDFVEKFVELFHSRKTFFLGISGLLVLHLLTDVGVFIIPHSFGNHTIYSEEFGINHLTLFAHFTADKLIELNLLNQFLMLIGYIFNTLGLTFLMLFPTFIWYVVYINHTTESNEAMIFPSFGVSLFYTSLIYLVFLPVFRIISILPGKSDVHNLLGVDIQTQSILTSTNSILIISGIALTVFLVTLILHNIKMIKAVLFYVMTFTGIGYFGFYIFNFFKSLLFFYYEGIKITVLSLNFLTNISQLINDIPAIFFIGFNVLSLIILIIFYVGGFFNFILHVFKSE
jgi:hypothetical protein